MPQGNQTIVERAIPDWERPIWRPFTEASTEARSRAQSFTGINPFNPPTKPVGQEPILFPMVETTKLRCREVKSLPQGHTTRSGGI